MAQQQTQNRQYGGILPSPLLNSLNNLVDRLNTSSTSNRTVHFLLVGTNEGVGLSRSYGSSKSENDRENKSPSISMDEEVLNSIETVWTTLPSACQPQIMAASVAAYAAASVVSSSNNNGNIENDSNLKSTPSSKAKKHYHQPPHPLLRPLGLGDEVRVNTAYYDNFTLMHLHMSPLVVTILMTPNANIGAIRSIAIPILRELLNPIRQSILESRKEAASIAASANHHHNLQQHTVQNGIHPMSAANNDGGFGYHHGNVGSSNMDHQQVAHFGSTTSHSGYHYG